jgi:arginase
MDLSLIQVPYDSGRFSERMGRGPLHLMERGLGDSLIAAGHDVLAVEVLLPEGFFPEMGSAVALQKKVFAAVTEARSSGRFPVVLAGNCNHAALGTVPALSAAGHTPGVLWFDAHGDFNTPEGSRSGFFDGMALSVLTGNCWDFLAAGLTGFAPVPEDDVLLIGARDLDGPEEELLKGSRITHVLVEEVRRRGVEEALGPGLERIAARTERLYLHVDLDVLDPVSLRANQFAVPGGLSLDELLQALRAALRLRPAGALALTAYDPDADRQERGLDAARAVIGTVVE